MSISVRGTATGTATTGAPVSVTLPVGTAQGDVCYLFVMSNSTADRVFTEQSGTWTKLADLYISGTSDDCNVAVFRKVQGATPDTAVTVSMDAGSSGQAALLFVFDGVDGTNPEDAPLVSVTAAGAADPDPPSITTVSDNAVVLAAGFASDADVVTNAPAGYSGLVNLVHQTNISITGAIKAVTPAGAENPAAFADIAIGAGDSSIAISIALRPEPVTAPVISRMCLLGVGGGTSGIITPAQQFVGYDEFRYGDVSEFGFIDLLVIYQSAMVAPGDTSTSPPDPAFLDDLFAQYKSDNPLLDKIVLDYEAWGNPATDATARGYFVTLLTACANHFSDPGLYGEIPERYTGMLTGGPANYQSRKDSWFARSALCQDMWDIVTTIYPSFYFINPVNDDEAQRDLWFADNKELCNLRAPGKKIIPFLWPRIHQSVDPNMPDVPGPYWRSTLESLRNLNFDGFAGWAEAGDTDPRIRNPVPAFWPETTSFMATL